ncbi:STAS domain-containing protein [Streptomyces sp. NPDC001523]|uniref:STAS domain-containing protein n=1 Tax=Streptomyces sp. NPDC001523 TaxID=3154383 RepID=UPI00331ECEEF
MTSLPTSPLQLTRIDTKEAVRIELRGDLDHDTADLLLDAVSRLLTERNDLRDVHLHCAELTAVDSTGLSVLLMVKRRTGAAGVHLHLDDRPTKLDRLLHVTGTLDHLTDTGGKSGSSTAERPSATSEKSIPARSGSPDTGV